MKFNLEQWNTHGPHFFIYIGLKKFFCNIFQNVTKVCLQMEISIQHHDSIKGPNGSNLRQIMEETNTTVRIHRFSISIFFFCIYPQLLFIFCCMLLCIEYQPTIQFFCKIFIIENEKYRTEISRELSLCFPFNREKSEAFYRKILYFFFC